MNKERIVLLIPRAAIQKIVIQEKSYKLLLVPTSNTYSHIAFVRLCACLKNVTLKARLFENGRGGGVSCKCTPSLNFFNIFELPFAMKWSKKKAFYSYPFLLIIKFKCFRVTRHSLKLNNSFECVYNNEQPLTATKE